MADLTLVALATSASNATDDSLDGGVDDGKQLLDLGPHFQSSRRALLKLSMIITSGWKVAHPAHLRRYRNVCKNWRKRVDRVLEENRGFRRRTFSAYFKSAQARLARAAWEGNLRDLIRAAKAPEFHFDFKINRKVREQSTSVLRGRRRYFSFQGQMYSLLEWVCVQGLTAVAALILDHLDIDFGEEAASRCLRLALDEGHPATAALIGRRARTLTEDASQRTLETCIDKGYNEVRKIAKKKLTEARKTRKQRDAELELVGNLERVAVEDKEAIENELHETTNELLQSLPSLGEKLGNLTLKAAAKNSDNIGINPVSRYTPGRSLLVPQFKTKGAETAIHIAAKSNHWDMVKLLLNREDIDLNDADADGVTALDTVVSMLWRGSPLLRDIVNQLADDNQFS